MTDAKEPERIWATGDARNGSWTHEQVPEKWGAAVTEYIRADLYDALAKERDELAARVKYLEGVGEVDGKLIQKTAGDAVRYKGQAEKSEAEVERLREALNDIYENVEYWNTLRISSKIRAALQRKEGNE